MCLCRPVAEEPHEGTSIFVMADDRMLRKMAQFLALQGNLLINLVRSMLGKDLKFFFPNWCIQEGDYVTLGKNQNRPNFL